MQDGRTADVCPQISKSGAIEASAAPKLDVEALRAEQAQCIRRAADIESLLTPPRIGQAVALVLGAGKPIKGCHVARMLGKSAGNVGGQLAHAVDRGLIRRVAVGTYAAPEVRS